MFAKLLITTFVIDRTSKLSTHAPKAFQVNCCLFKLGTQKFQRNFCFKSTGASSLRGAPDIRALIKKFPEIELKKERIVLEVKQCQLFSVHLKQLFCEVSYKKYHQRLSQHRAMTLCNQPYISVQTSQELRMLSRSLSVYQCLLVSTSFYQCLLVSNSDF